MLAKQGPSNLTREEAEVFLSLLARIYFEKTTAEVAEELGVWRATSRRWEQTKRIRRSRAITVMRKLRKEPGKEPNPWLVKLTEGYLNARGKANRQRALLRIAMWMTEQLQSIDCQVTLVAQYPALLLEHGQHTEVRVVEGHLPCYQVKDYASGRVEFEGVIDSSCLGFIKQYVDWVNKNQERKQKLFNTNGFDNAFAPRQRGAFA